MASRNGGRFRFGGWIDPCQWRGFKLDYFYLEGKTEPYSQTSDGAPILARPFFNTQLNSQDSELVAYPGIVSGTVAVDATSKFRAFSPRYRRNLRCQNFLPDPACGCGACNACGDTYCLPMGGAEWISRWATAT